MDFRIKQHLSKSSDILNEPTTHHDEFLDHRTSAVSSPQNRSACQHSRVRKRSVDEVQSFERRQESPVSKSHEFLKKIFNSDKKNVACKADNEFVTRYYAKASRSEDDCSRSFDEKEFPQSNYRTYIKRSLQRDFESFDNRENTFAETFLDGVSHARHHENDFTDKLTSQRYDDFFLNNRVIESNEARRQSSSCATLERHARKKVSRKKSFKQLLSSMIKWKGAGSKQSAKRFLSYDDLLDGEAKCNSSDADNLSRTVSLQTVILPAKSEESTTENQRKAPSRDRMNSACGSSKDELQKWVVEETKRLFFTEESNFTSNGNGEEILVKPSAIKDISRRYSQILELQQIEKSGNRVSRCKSVRADQLYSRDKNLSNKQHVTVCDTRM